MIQIRSMIAAAALIGAATTVSAQTTITGAGATFPNPIYTKWFDEYHKAHSNIEINYQSVGSGAGIRNATDGIVDFGASDMPMTEEQMKNYSAKRGTALLHFPTVLGAVVPVYNIPGVTADIKFTPEALAGIYLGKITKWNDSELTKANPGLKLPGNDIVVVHRSDGSGTTFVWTDYLSKVSPEWKSKVKSGTSVNWPVGLGGKGNEGVAGQVKQTQNSIGYVELIYAIQNKMSYGLVRNKAGKFLKADLKGVSAAAAGITMPDDFRVSVTDASGAAAYPICSFTWLLIPEDWKDKNKMKVMKEFLTWMLGPGQAMTSALDYAPLPKPVVAKEEKQIAKIH